MLTDSRCHHDGCVDRPCLGRSCSVAGIDLAKMTNMSNSSAMPLRGRRFISRLVAAILLLAVLVAGVWLGRAPLLRGAANLWIVSDPVIRSDVVVILGGGLDI